MLRPMRGEWDMVFATGGQEALDTLAREHFDVLVSDMRMPGIDGPTLMREVRQRHPQIVRIVLSGHSSRATTVRSVGLAHQYLTKPCDKETLEGTIARASKLREVLGDESLAHVLARMKSLPSLPKLYAEVIAELQREDATIKKVGEIISKDPAMTAKVLQLVNSAFFGLPRRTSNPAQAVVLLGTDTLKTLVLGIGIFSQFSETAATSSKLGTVWGHSLWTAATAKQLALSEGASQEAPDDAFSGALLHDIGKLILAHSFPSQYHEALDQADNRCIEQREAERQVFRTTHAEVGAYLLALWGLPDPVVSAVVYHHCPEAAGETAFGSATAVHVANALEHERHTAHKHDTAGHLNVDHLSRLGLAPRVDVWRKFVGKLPPDELPSVF
jgi:putative nucleotidyltransferase with HDIG domain